MAMAVGLLIVAVLLLFSLRQISSGTSATGGAGGAGGPGSILSRSSAETQIKLCAEGRDSTYGSPPRPAVQATCVRELLAEISATGSTIPQNP